MVPVLSVEITNVCNSRCVFCPNAIMKRRKEHLDMPLFKQGVDQYFEMGGTRVNFNCLVGEPFLDPHLMERIAYVRSHSQVESLTFFSTLQWLHKWDVDAIVSSGITALFVSVVLSGRDKYREFFGVDHYEQVLSNIDLLVEAIRKNNNDMTLELSLKPTGERAEQIVSHPDFIRIEGLTGGKATKALEEMGMGVHDYSGKVRLPHSLRRRPLYPRYKRPCRLLYDHLKIFSNGNAGLCVCSDFEADSGLIIGNCRQSTVEALWNGDNAESIRRAWKETNQVPAICKSCRAYVY